MIKRIDAIEFVFENCETAYIPFKCVYLLNTGTITNKLDFCTGSYQNSNEFRFMYYTDYLKVEFTDFEKIFYRDCLHEEKLFKDRLRFNDITSIVIHYGEFEEQNGDVLSVDYKEFQLYIPWEDDEFDEYTNKLQKVDFKLKGQLNKHTIQDENIMTLTIGK